MSAFHREKVLSVRHWTDRLFSFRTTRAPAFRFRSGQFVMMGLEGDGKPLLRAYSLASSPRAFSTSKQATKSSLAASRPARW